MTGLRVLCAAGLLGAALACSPAPSRSAADRLSPEPEDGPVWLYEVRADSSARELRVEGTFPPGPAGELTLSPESRAFVRDVEGADAGRWRALEAREGAWTLPRSSEARRVRYRFLLAEAAAESDDVAVARAVGSAVEAPPSTWLLRPAQAAPATRFRFHVVCAPGETFVTGIFPVPGAADAYGGAAGEMGRLPYSAFGAFRVREIDGGRIVAVLLPGELRDEAVVVDWITTSARAVAGYYGRFPVARLAVFVRPRSGDGVGFGTTMGQSGASIAVDVGASATRADLREDWVLTHEMVHTALPELPRPHRWLEEGLATYVEPVARAQAGILAPERFWADWLRDMPNGLPGKDDLGLDVTHTWGRTYWGGALFCLQADLEIRERTQQRKSLQDALRGILAAGGDISVRWPIERVLEVGDAATGVPVLRELYDRMKDARVDVDLASIWKRLGVASQGRKVSFDDAAPLAAVRRALTDGSR